jgi:phage host-nuclease inhibitor protein Gam
MNRIKLQKNPVEIPATRAEAEALVRRLTTNLLAQQAAKTEMDQRITAIKKEYESKCSKLEESIQPMMESIHAWADAHSEEFGGKKSLDMLHAIIGWRVNPPSLKPLRGFTWGAVMGRIKDLGKWEFIRTKEDVNKEALLAARDTENLKAFYCAVAQDEEFFCDPKTTPVETRQTAS